MRAGMCMRLLVCLCFCDACLKLKHNLIIVSHNVGIDAMLANMVHADHVYQVQDIVFNGKFVDMIHDERGRRTVDFAKFNAIDYRNVDTVIVTEQMQ